MYSCNMVEMKILNVPIKVESGEAINMSEQRASDLPSLPCTWFSHWNFVIDPIPIWAFWSNKSVELRV